MVTLYIATYITKTSKGRRDSDVLTDIPGKTNLAECTVEQTDDIPFRVKAYPVP